MRSNLISTIALSLLAPAVFLPPPSAAAAAPSCRGLPATIAAQSGSITGTDGDDVIVASGRVTSVRAGGGNDTICARDTLKRPIFISGDAGNDTVDTTQTAKRTATFLGTGANRFYGGSANDSVVFGGPDFHVHGPGEDTVSTGAGNDAITAIAGTRISAGRGRDDVALHIAPGQSSTVSPVELGPGPDTFGSGSPNPGTTIFADLSENVFTVNDTTIPLRRAEHLTVPGGQTIKLIGNGKPNRFTVHACDAVLVGRGSRDRLTFARAIEDSAEECPRPPRGLLKGGAGGDILTGHDGPDVLIGGSGFDLARGGDAVDKCRAEREKNCER